MHKANSVLLKSAIAVAVGVCLQGPAAAQQNEIQLLREQLKQMQQRLETLERDKVQQEASKSAQPAAVTTSSAAGSQAVTGGDIKGSFKLPGSNTSVAIGGVIKAVGIFNEKSAGPADLSDELLVPQSIPLSNAAYPPAEKNKVKLMAKESRLTVRTSTPSSYGTLTTFLEGDFFGSGGSQTSTNGYGFRLRHAWGALGNFQIGQNWSAALNYAAVPETIDFTPNIGIFGATRQVGVRWTQPFSGGAFTAALENPETIIGGANPQPDNDKYPDLVAKVGFGAGGGNYEVVGIVRSLRANQAGVSNQLTSKGIAFSGGVPFSGTDKLVFGVGYSDAGGRYWGAASSDAFVLNGSLQGIKQKGGYVGLRHQWSPTLRSNIDLAILKLSNPSGVAATVDKEYSAAHINVFWLPLSNFELGAEYLWAKREVESGLNGKLNRLLVSGRLFF